LHFVSLLILEISVLFSSKARLAFFLQSVTRTLTLAHPTGYIIPGVIILHDTTEFATSVLLCGKSTISKTVICCSANNWAWHFIVPFAQMTKSFLDQQIS